MTLTPAQALAALREINVRRGYAAPRGARERRWAAQGPRPVEALDTLRGLAGRLAA